MPKPDQGPPARDRLDSLNSEITRRGPLKTAAVLVRCDGALSDGALDGTADGANVRRDKFAGTLERAASSGRPIEKGSAKKERIQAGARSHGAADGAADGKGMLRDKFSGTRERAASSGRPVEKGSANEERVQAGARSHGAADGAVDGKDMPRDEFAGKEALAGSSGRPVEKGSIKEEPGHAGAGHSPGPKLLNGWQIRVAQESRVAHQIQAALRNQHVQQHVHSRTKSRGTAHLCEDNGGSSGHRGSSSSFGDDGDWRAGNHSTPDRLMRVRRALYSGGGVGIAEGRAAGWSLEVHGGITTVELQEAITAAAERLR